jgi:sugar lactone lactonase YvrE
MIRSRNNAPVCATALFALLGACSASPLLPQAAPASSIAAPAPAAPWRPVDASTGRITDLAGLTAHAADFPDSASVQRRLLSAALRENEATVARAALQSLEAMGYALSAAAFDALAPLIGQAEAKAAQLRAETLREPVGASAVIAQIPPEHRLVEGVAWDAATERLFLSSVVDRRLLVLDGIRAGPIDGAETGSMFGLAIDSERRLLWSAAGTVEQTPSPGSAFSGLVAIHLDRLEQVRRIRSPDGVSLSNIAVAPDGTVYVDDSNGGGVFRFVPGADALETLVEPGTALRSPQGIALHPDGRRLYIGDYSYGIAIVDLATRTVGRLAATSPLMLDGVDGLYWLDGGLVAIQNGTNPMRIVRIAIDPSGTRANGLTVVEANNPEWGEPTIGQMAGNQLIYVSDPVEPLWAGRCRQGG